VKLEFRRLQAAVNQIIEERPPGGFTLAAHVLDREQYLLTVLPDAEGNKKGDRRRFLVEPDAHGRAVEVNRMIGSSFRERAFQASQSPFTLRHTRLTVSLPTAPPNKAASALRTRRVLVPAR
jgi:hypothetical protein